MTVVAPTGTDLAQFLTILPSLTGQINADIAAVGASSQAAPRLAAGTDLNDLDTPRTDWVTATIDSIGNVPPGEVAGFVRTFWQSTTNRVQVWYTSGLSTNVWIRFRGSSGWTAWKRMDAQYAIDAAAAYTDNAVSAVSGGGSGSGFKTVPLALTVGGTAGTYTQTTRGIRMPMTFAPTISRWRVHVRNINPRFGLNNTGAVSLTGLWFGVHDGTGGFVGTPTQIVGAVSTGSDGSEYVSPWVTSPIGGGTSYLLAYGYTATAATQSVIGGGWYTSSATDAANPAAGKAIVSTMPLDVWLEAETSATTPVVAGVGDSLMSGVGSTLPVHDSTVSQYARANGALPVHYSASGDAASASTDATAYKWTRWKNFAKPDAALVGMGSNDVFGGDSLATLQANYQALLAIVTSAVSKNVYVATLMPRDAVTGAQEDTRRSFNTWLKSGALMNVRDVFDFVPGVSSDDEALKSTLTSDGIHLTTAGYGFNKKAISRTLAPSTAVAPTGAISGVSLALTDTATNIIPQSIGTDGYLYGYTSSRVFPVRSGDGLATAVEQGPNFVTLAGAGSGIAYVTRTSAGYVVIYQTNATTYSVWFSTTFASGYTKVLDMNSWHFTSWAKPRLIAGTTWMLLGEYQNTTFPSYAMKRWLSTDGGQTWNLIRSTQVINNTINSHNHTALIRGDGRIYVSEGDGPNNWFAYSDDKGASWIAIPTDPAIQIDAPYFPQPTVLIDFGDNIAMSPDRGSYQPGFWLMDPHTHKQRITWELLDGGPYFDASKQYGRAVYAQAGATGKEAYVMFPDAGAGTNLSYIAATPDGGKRWATVAAIPSTGGTLNAGVIGPDRNGYLFVRGAAIPTYGSNVIRANVIDWSRTPLA